MESKKDKGENYRALFFLLAALSIILVISLVHIFTSVLFLAGITVNHFVLPIACAVTAAVIGAAVFTVFKELKWRLAISGGLLLTLLAVGALSWTIAVTVYDTSWDGQDYHQVGIIKLAEGWNPVRDTILRTISVDSSVAIWSTHYPKAAWIFAANIYRLTGFLEAGKSLNLLLLFASFFACLSLFLYSKRFSLISALITALLIGCNPISMYQFLSFYVDGVLSSALIILLALGGLLLMSKRIVLAGCAFALMLIFLINIKFTGMVYGGLAVAGLSAGVLIVHKNFKSAFKTGLLFTTVFLIGFFIVGFNPYITNIQQKGNPLHPVFGKQKVDIISMQLPRDFRQMGRTERFYRSIFSRSGGLYSGTGFSPSRLKVPFTIDNTEIPAMGLDTRVGGFGPLFSGILLTSLVLLGILLFLALRKKALDLLLLYGGFLAWIGVSVFFNSQSWWARFVPQLWLFPMVILLFSFDRHIAEFLGSNMILKGLMKFLQTGFVLLAVSNITMSANYYVETALEINNAAKEQLEIMKNSEGAVYVAARRFELSFYTKLKDAGIQFKKVAALYNSQFGQTFVYIPSYGGINCGINRATEDKKTVEQPVITSLPESYEIIPPPPELPEQLAAFSGRWVTRWSGWIDTRFIILEIDRKKAKVLFSWGNQLAMTGRHAGYEIVEAAVEKSAHQTALRFTDSGKVELLLIMGPNLNSLEGIALTKSYESSAYIRREDNKVVKGSKGAILKDPVTLTPLPDDRIIEKPAPDVDSRMAKYSGRWEGYVSGQQGITVVVESVTSRAISFIISWDDFTPQQMKAGFARDVAYFVKGDTLAASTTLGNGMPFVLREGSEKDSLELLLGSGYQQVTAYLRRCKEGS